MKKLSTLFLALLASIGLWATDPDVSFVFESQTIGNYIKNYIVGSDTIKVTTSATSISSGNGGYYFDLSSNSSAFNTNYLSVKVTGGSTISKIAIYATGSGNSKHVQAPVVGWENGWDGTSTTADAGKTLDFTSASSNGGKYSTAAWKEVDVDSWNAKEVRAYKKLSTVTVTGYTLPTEAETLRVWGLKVWLHPASPSLKAITIAGIEAEIAAAASASDPDTIKAVLPHGTVINDAIDAIDEDDVELGGSATSYEIANDRSKLTVYDEGKAKSKEYVFALTVNATASSDATLSALALNGTDVTLEESVYTYNVNLSWAASVTATYTTNDVNATASVDYSQSNKVVITVTAEDKDPEHTKVYTVNYTMAAAKKDLLEVLFNNGAKGVITNGLIRVPYIAETDEPTFVSAKFWNADGTPTAAMQDDKLKVTGADGTDSLYNIEIVAITPASLTYDTQITFDSTETYIFSTYTWASDRGWKISKDVEEASNKRISEGRSRIYFALPKAASIELTSGSGGDRPVKIYVNGVEDSNTKLGKSGQSITVELNSNTTNLLAIESNGSNGDGGITKIQVAKPISTALDNTADEAKAVKRLVNGQLFIEKNGHVYNVLGGCVK